MAALISIFNSVGGCVNVKLSLLILITGKYKIGKEFKNLICAK